ncbi:hypothetical protein M0813_13997 [Anaeramoeba flamelloides]|uniref:Uncharacterized protein n=1 Tax=Anaeramoeba flamelloides TaxID=1746091 RepID=A0ABQ8Z7D3_9EUKA|nr:hypothetical protein M0813_13997 [Anaeramoeba flamelloides]
MGSSLELDSLDSSLPYEEHEVITRSKKTPMPYNFPAHDQNFDEVFEEHLNKNRSEMDFGALELGFDTGWSSAHFKGGESSTVAIDLKTGKTFDLICMIKGRNYEGPSNGMECGAIEDFCQKWDKYNQGDRNRQIKIQKVIKDGDSQTLAIFQKVWPECKAALDLNHYLKSKRKLFEKVTGFYSFFKKIKHSMLAYLRTLIKFNLNAELYYYYVFISIFHFLDDHRFCIHKEEKAKGGNILIFLD